MKQTTHLTATTTRQGRILVLLAIFLCLPMSMLADKEYMYSLNLSALAVNVNADGTVTTPEITGLPNDYTGTITYSSQTPDIATVAEDGTVTWKGGALRMRLSI